MCWVSGRSQAARSGVRTKHALSNVVVLGEGLWRRRFGADPTLVGRTARLGGTTFTVIGIVPANFQFDLPGTTSAGPSMMWTLLTMPEGVAPLSDIHTTCRSSAG